MSIQIDLRISSDLDGRGQAWLAAKSPTKTQAQIHAMLVSIRAW